MTPPPAPVDPLSAPELLRLLDTSLGATVSVMDTHLRFRYVTAGFAQAFDLQPAAMVGMSVRDVYSEADFATFYPYLQRVLAGEKVHYERLGRIHLREQVWRTVSLCPCLDAFGKVAGIMQASLAVHELKASTEALRLANERLSSHMDNSPLSVFELDASLRITRASLRVAAMLGLQAEQIVGQELLCVLASAQGAATAGPDEDTTLASLKSALARLQRGEETRNRVDSSHHVPSGARVHCQWFNSALVDAQGRVSSIMALVEDVSAQVEAEAQLRKLALNDQLTGLANRNAFSVRLEASLARAARTHLPVVLLFIDLDGFKSVNDGFGHASGDEVLCEVARRLLLAVRNTDVVARLGGDEFVVLLDTEVQPGTPERVCERIFSLLASPCEFSNGQAQIGVSIGVAKHPPLPHDAALLIKRADAAMFEAKRAGKGCVREAAA